MNRSRVGALGVVCLLILLGCSAPSPPRLAPPWSPAPPAVPPPTLPTPTRIDNEIYLPWGQDEAVLIVVDKGCHTLNVYQYGRLTRTYPVVFGRRPGPKLYEGDRRTPIGLYMVIGKRSHDRWSRFLLLDYPTDHDIHRYRSHLASGQIPRRENGYPGVGGAIGIHGTSREALNRAGVNWTLGCISMFNNDVRELYATIPPGTLVYIKE